MRLLLTCILGILAVLTLIAEGLKPAALTDEKTPLVWVSDNNPERQRQIQAFNELHPDLNLVLDYSNTGLQKIIVQCSSGVGPDLADGGGVALQTLVDAGIAWDVTAGAAELGFAVQDTVWPGVIPELTHDGRQYGYPCNVTVEVLIYNKNIFDRLGVPYPTAAMTWDEFVAVAKRVTRIERSSRETIYGVTGMNWRHYFSMSRGEFFSADGTRLWVQAPALATAFQMHHDALFKHRITPNSLEMRTMSSQGGWGTGAINLFADGRFAMFYVGKWALIRLRGAHADQVRKGNAARVLRLGSVLGPRLADRPPCYRVGSRAMAINARSPHRQEALKFLQFLAGPEYSRLINEGVDSLPGNPAHARLGVREGVPDLAEVELHENSLRAMESCYRPRQSPFLLETDLERVIAGQIGRMESDPHLRIADLLQAAEEELIALMQRNLDRDPAMKARYRELTGTDDVFAAHAGRQP